MCSCCQALIPNQLSGLYSKFAHIIKRKITTGCPTATGHGRQVPGITKMKNNKDREKDKEEEVLLKGIFKRFF